MNIVNEDRVRAFVQRKRNHHFSVQPRYSPGSGASVSLDLALRVAQDEVDDYEWARMGRYGEEAKTRAYDLGLFGIAECLVEERKAWRVMDLITGEVYERPFKVAQPTRKGT